MEDNLPFKQEKRLIETIRKEMKKILITIKMQFSIISSLTVAIWFKLHFFLFLFFLNFLFIVL